MSFASALGGQCFPGFDDSAGIGDTSQVIVIRIASGARVHEPSC
jgi:hypothetical protein